jgi:TonB family protein
MTPRFIRYSTRPLILILLLCFTLPGISRAATPVDLDDLAARLAPEIDKNGVKSIAVVDFVTTDEKATDLGWYLANKLADGIVIKSPSTLVIDRKRMQQLGQELGSPTSDALRQNATKSGADAIVTGKIELTGEKYLLTINLVKVADGSNLASLSQSLSHSRVLDLLSPIGDHATRANPSRAGVNGVGVPQCIYCPAPAYPGGVGLSQTQSVVLMVTISVAGSAEKISVVRSPGYQLSERAAEVVSEWKFRPAPGGDGKPTTVAVPVEVTFKASRT